MEVCSRWCPLLRLWGSPRWGVGFSPQAPSTLNGALGCDAIASTPTGNGYWLLNAFRSAMAFGQAGQAVQIGCTSLNGATGRWTGMASSPTGNGFFVTGSNGGVEGCGDAVPVGGLTAKTLNATVVGMAATSDGKGYWLVAADGGVFSFGDAPFFGSMGGTHLNAPVVGKAATPDGKGYWLVAADGGCFLRRCFLLRIDGWDTPECPRGGDGGRARRKGLLAAAADGGVFSFGSAPFEGSMGGSPLNAPVVGIAALGSSVPG